MERVGPNGVITVEESQTLGMEIEHVEGMQLIVVIFHHTW